MIFTHGWIFTHGSFFVNHVQSSLLQGHSRGQRNVPALSSSAERQKNNSLYCSRRAKQIFITISLSHHCRTRNSALSSPSILNHTTRRPLLTSTAPRNAASAPPPPELGPIPEHQHAGPPAAAAAPPPNIEKAEPLAGLHDVIDAYENNNELFSALSREELVERAEQLGAENERLTKQLRDMSSLSSLKDLRIRELEAQLTRAGLAPLPGR